jgi:hypothetical protein
MPNEAANLPELGPSGMPLFWGAGTSVHSAPNAIGIPFAISHVLIQKYAGQESARI